MTMYFLIFVVLLCAVCVGFRSKGCILNKSSYIFATLLLIACAGLRADSVGRDYDTYSLYYATSPETVGIGFFAQWISTMPAVDVAFVYFDSLVKMIGLPLEAYFFLVALIAVSLNASFFWRHSRFSAIALMVYFSHAFLVREMIQIRTGLACGIILWAFHFWATERKVLGGILMLLAIATHLAAAVAIIPLLLFQLKIDAKPRYVLLTLFVAIAVGYTLSSAFPIFALIDRLAAYQDSEYSVATGIFTNVVTIKQAVILGLCCWLTASREEQPFSPVVRLCVISYWISTLWIIAFNQFQIVGSRGAAFFWMGEPVIIAQIIAALYIDTRLRRYRRIAFAAVIGFALATLILDLKAKEVINDYKTVFQESRAFLPYELNRDHIDLDSSGE